MLLFNTFYITINIDHHLKEALTMKFVEVLEDAGVFKMNEEGKAAFEAFVTGVGEDA